MLQNAVDLFTILTGKVPGLLPTAFCSIILCGFNFAYIEQNYADKESVKEIQYTLDVKDLEKKIYDRREKILEIERWIRNDEADNKDVHRRDELRIEVEKFKAELRRLEKEEAKENAD